MTSPRSTSAMAISNSASCSGEIKRLVVIARKNGDDSTLVKGCAFNDDPFHQSLFQSQLA